MVRRAEPRHRVAPESVAPRNSQTESLAISSPGGVYRAAAAALAISQKYIVIYQMHGGRLALSSGVSFETVILPHLDAAYNFARWLTRDSGMAEDIVQEAIVRVLTYSSGFRGISARLATADRAQHGV